MRRRSRRSLLMAALTRIPVRGLLQRLRYAGVNRLYEPLMRGVREGFRAVGAASSGKLIITSARSRRRRTCGAGEFGLDEVEMGLQLRVDVPVAFELRRRANTRISAGARAQQQKIIRINSGASVTLCVTVS